MLSTEVDRLTRTDTGRLGDLYLTHADDAVRLAYLLTGDRALAEDLVQDALVRLAGRVVHLRDPGAFHAYLRRTIVNLSNSHFRRRKVERAYLERAGGAIGAYPAALETFGTDLGSADALAVLALAPTPAQARSLSTARIAGALRKGGRERRVVERAGEIRQALRGSQLEAPAPGQPAHIEIPADDTAKGREFWGSLFGWQFQAYPGPFEYHMTQISDGVGGAITNMEPGKRGIRTYFAVDDIQAGAKLVRELGGEAGEPAPVPSMGWFAVCKDTQGNDFGLWQTDPSAPNPTG